MFPFGILALINSIAHTLYVPHHDNSITHSIHTLPSSLTIINARALICVRGRGRAFAPKCGRGDLRGGRNAVALVHQHSRYGCSPIATHISTLHDANSTIGDTIATFVQVMPTHHAFYIITARQKRVENVFGGLNSQISTKPTKIIHTIEHHSINRTLIFARIYKV